ncbi:MAG: hypothetical protein NZ516_08415 [Raineya sp.]|nr:hypothetical protein [Raineya sp.]
MARFIIRALLYLVLLFPTKIIFNIMKNILITLVFAFIVLGVGFAQNKNTQPQQNKTDQKSTVQKDNKTQQQEAKKQEEKKQEVKKEEKKEVKKELNPRIENCNPTGYVRDITETLKSSGYKFLRSYNLEGPSNKPIQHEYTLSKGTTYAIRIASYVDSNLKVTLYDPEGRVIASTYDSENQKFYPSIEILCHKTGVYKISFEHHFNKRDFCGGAVLCFKR